MIELPQKNQPIEKMTLLRRTRRCGASFHAIPGQCDFCTAPFISRRCVARMQHFLLMNEAWTTE
jgi:hypothetical protein